MNTPLLIASDIDGTLLDDRERVTPRLRAAIDKVVRAGAVFCLATGRPARWVSPVVTQLPFPPMCVCANGAVLYDAANDRIVQHRSLATDDQHRVVELANAALAEFGGVQVAAERAGATAWDDPAELFVCELDYSHVWDSSDHGVMTADDVMAAPATKLLLRNQMLDSAQMYERVAPAIPADLAHVTYSISEGLLEVCLPGVNKSVGLEDLAENIGAAAEQTVAFGDMPNDIEMLQWSGLGVAMANAAEPVKAVADEVTTANSDFGVARVIERWL